MSDILWPSSLQQLVEQSSFGLDTGESVIRSQMDIGPAKIRRRFTKQIDNLNVSIQVTSTQYTTLVDFYRVDLNGGVNQFVFNHPITGSPVYIRFVAAPKFKSLGGSQFEASMAWEILP